MSKTAAPNEEAAQDKAERTANAMFSRDKASQALGCRLGPVAPGAAELSMVVREDMLNGHSTCHGGFIFSLADSAFGFACNSHNEVSVAAGAEITFLKPAYLGAMLTARAREIYYVGRNGVYDVEVRNGDNEVIAHFRGKSRTIAGVVVEQTKQ